MVAPNLARRDAMDPPGTNSKKMLRCSWLRSVPCSSSFLSEKGTRSRSCHACASLLAVPPKRQRLPPDMPSAFKRIRRVW